MWFLQAFVQLVKFHQHTGIGLIQVECLLHVFQSLRLTVLLIETCQGKITPHGREARVKLSRQLPVLYSLVILAGSIIQAAKVVRSHRSAGVQALSTLESYHILRSVREAVCIICLLCLIVTTHIIVCHRSSGIRLYCHAPDGCSLFREACRLIVKCHLIIVLGNTHPCLG